VSTLLEVSKTLLEEGTDLQIDQNDWDSIRATLPADGRLTKEDIHVLLDLRSRAYSACPAFDAFFFPALKKHLLADGVITPMEQFQLLRMLYGGHRIDDAERRFLTELRSELREVTPEFEAMYRQVMKD
jgi:hypothetical protein